MRPDPPPSRLPPSGAWSGYYPYAPGGPPHRMRLNLTFAPDGGIAGDGVDDIGDFLIDGVFDAGTLEASWTKSYIGMHRVAYHGYYDQRSIWGTWSLEGATGGFRIWPSALEEAEEQAAAEELEQPAEPALVTAEE